MLEGKESLIIIEIYKFTTSKTFIYVLIRYFNTQLNLLHIFQTSFSIPIATRIEQRKYFCNFDFISRECANGKDVRSTIYVSFATQCLMGGWWDHYSFRCQPVDYSNSPTAIRVSVPNRSNPSRTVQRDCLPITSTRRLLQQKSPNHIGSAWYHGYSSIKRIFL